MDIILIITDSFFVHIHLVNFEYNLSINSYADMFKTIENVPNISQQSFFNF